MLFDVATKQETEIDHTLFPNPFSISRRCGGKTAAASPSSTTSAATRLYTVIEVDAQTGKTRPLIDEQTKTFFYYNDLGPGLSAGRKYRHDVNDGKEIIWASERDGWEHLYLYDGVTGKVKNQITKGNWLVRNVEYVDDAKRQIWFEAGGIVPGQDPYFTQLYRINFDGTGLTKLTDADGTHTVSFSHDHKFYVDTWQRVDLAPVAQLRRTADQTVVTRSRQGRHVGSAGRGLQISRSLRSQRPRRQDGHLGHHHAADELRSFEEVSGHREYLRRSAGFVRPQDVQRGCARPGARGTRIHRRSHRRHGHQQSLQGLPRCGLQEPRRRRLPRPHPVAQGGGREVSVLRHLARRHLRHFSRWAEFARRRPLPSGVL